MLERIGLGPAPAEEECASTLEPDFASRNKAECIAYITAIKRVCGEPPPGACLTISTKWPFIVKWKSFTTAIIKQLPSMPRSATKALLRPGPRLGWWHRAD